VLGSPWMEALGPEGDWAGSERAWPATLGESVSG